MDHLGGVILLSILAIVATLWVLPIVCGIITMRSLVKAELELLPPDEARDCVASTLACGIVDPQWLSSCQFEPLGAYRVTHAVLQPRLVAWRRADERTYLCVHIVGERRAMEFVSILGDQSLTTGNSKDEQMTPGPPRHWKQTFSVSHASQLWIHHDSALQWLIQRTGMKPDDRGTSLEEDFRKSISEESAYIRSLPLWPLRIPYWYLVVRHRRHNKSIQKLAGDPQNP
jgi:hypothetical protein